MADGSMVTDVHYEAEVRRELERRASPMSMHMHIGRSQSHVQTSSGIMQEELDRRLRWAQQMILTNPALCANSCQLSGMQASAAPSPSNTR